MLHPDQSLIQSLLNGESAGIRTIYERCAEKVKWYILQHGGTEADAADVFQESLISIFLKASREGLQLSSPIEALVFTICRNKWTDIIRSRGRQNVTNTSEERILDSDVNTFGEAEQIHMQQQRRDLLYKVLDGMGEPCRRLLELSWQGLGMEEVAVQMNMTYSFVRKKKSQCIGKLSQLMKEAAEYTQLKW